MANDAVVNGFELLREQLGEAFESLLILNYLRGLMADENAALNAKLDELQSTLDTVQQAVVDQTTAAQKAADAQAAVIADLQNQLATGPSGLTADQVTAAITRLGTIEDDLRTTVAASPVAPAPTDPAAPASGGETNVPIPGASASPANGQ